MISQSLKIGEVAKLAGVNKETVRYYERRGLIPIPPKRESGYRDYPLDTVDRIRFIKEAQNLGFTLKEISELLFLATDENLSCAEVRSLAEKKLLETEQKIKHLSQLYESLTELVEACLKDGRRNHCPIIESLTRE